MSQLDFRNGFKTVTNLADYVIGSLGVPIWSRTIGEIVRSPSSPLGTLDGLVPVCFKLRGRILF